LFPSVMSLSSSSATTKLVACAEEGCSNRLPGFDSHLLCRTCRSCTFDRQCDVCSSWSPSIWTKVRKQQREAERKRSKRKMGNKGELLTEAFQPTLPATSRKGRLSKHEGASASSGSSRRVNDDADKSGAPVGAQDELRKCSPLSSEVVAPRAPGRAPGRTTMAPGTLTSGRAPPPGSAPPPGWHPPTGREPTPSTSRLGKDDASKSRAPEAN
jgi:hypothetical protein